MSRPKRVTVPVTLRLTPEAVELLDKMCDRLTYGRARLVEKAIAMLAEHFGTEGCTGVSARWCPEHGRCTCRTDHDLDDEHCALHSWQSTHGAEEFERMEQP